MRDEAVQPIQRCARDGIGDLFSHARRTNERVVVAFEHDDGQARVADPDHVEVADADLGLEELGNGIQDGFRDRGIGGSLRPVSSAR